MTLRPVFLTLADVTFATGISRPQLYRLFEQGQLKSELIAGRRRIPVDDLERYLGRPVRVPTRIAAE
jgi:excisionase family DNA binding protein